MKSEILHHVRAGITFVICGTMLAGCKLAPEQQSPYRFTLTPQAAPSENFTPELGLAMSGGGIRSALFNIGVLKRLHDEGLLKRVDVISTVSGGSYTAFWLYTNHLAAGGESEFGARSLASDVFTQRLCDLRSDANFVTWKNYLTTLPTGPSYIAMYERELDVTFSPDRHPSKDFLLSDLAAAPSSGKTPYLIMNATLNSPKPKLGWADGRLELTPLFAGNEAFGYHAWRDGSLPIRQAAAISGAAVKYVLRQRFDIPSETGVQNVSAFDGGGSENLAAIALIRRGVRHIIVVDAGHDPDYEFEDYRNLRDRLKNWELKLAMPTIEDFLATKDRTGSTPAERLLASFHKGTVHQISARSGEGPATSNIYYIKMSSAPLISDPRLSAESEESGRVVSVDFERAFKTVQDSTTRGRWDCKQIAPVLTRSNTPDFLAFALSEYYDFAQRSLVLKATQLPKLSFLASPFPQHRTIDQSYYGNQAQAFIALGYLEAAAISAQLGPATPVVAKAP